METPSEPHGSSEKPETPNASSLVDAGEDDGGVALDLSAKTLEFPMLEKVPEEGSVESLYLYRNFYNLVPKSVLGLGRLRTIKFFGNEVNVFAPESECGDLMVLECLQVKISSIGIGGLELHRLKGLKELELSNVPPKPSAFPILTQIAGLDRLIKLSICHFSLRYLPPEIGCLKNIEYLDISFNKLKTLPSEISCLKALISLKVANNKLVELPSAMNFLSRLENLDLSNNRLMSLGSLELSSLHKLQNLNLQYNKLFSISQIPSWICCNMEGNDGVGCNDDCSSSYVEMDFCESSIQENDGAVSCGSHNMSSSLLISSSKNRCSETQKSGKRWRRRQHYLRKKVLQECLNSSRKLEGADDAQSFRKKILRTREPENLDNPASKSCRETVSGNSNLDADDKRVSSEEAENENIVDVDDVKISIEKQFTHEDCGNLDNPASKSCRETVSDNSNLNADDKRISPEDAENENLIDVDDVKLSIENQFTQEGCCNAEKKDREDACSYSLENGPREQDESSSPVEVSKCASNTKRHSGQDLDNPKPCKSRKPMGDSSLLSCKYSEVSFCGIEDRLPDGFYDAGRDRPFMPLENYERNQCLASREVILLNSKRDEELDAIVLSAQEAVFRLKQLNDLNRLGNQAVDDNLSIASLLALFVSDHFGGSDRSALVERTRKSASASNYNKPFICTCSTGSSTDISVSAKSVVNTIENINLSNICEKSLNYIKKRRNSIIIPIGAVQFGVCRHRALLLKYLCDHMEPPIPCELVRGYLDFLPHAWNVILIKRGDIWIRMLVDACRPHDIREEKDPEYFCRYIPLCQIKIPLSTEESPGPGYSFPSLSACGKLERKTSTALVRCKLGSVEAAAKVRTLEVKSSSADKIKTFESNFLGEVRILGALKHPCIVEMYGHRIFSQQALSADGDPEHRLLRSAIFMEYVDGGSLKNYLKKLSEVGEKHVPLDLALYIAKDVAYALSELHSNHIIHRDIKSENILFDLDRKRDDGTPLVKLCDFDSAVPLRSSLHACCIAHVGAPPPSVCVGTPRWMAPEVMQTMYKESSYGLEADIWSFGCLLLEMLTLQIPYSGVPDSHFHDMLLMGKRPRLSDELEALSSMNEPTMIQSGEELEKSDAEEEGMLKFLVDLFLKCVEENQTKRPTALEIHDMLLIHTGRCSC